MPDSVEQYLPLLKLLVSSNKKRRAQIVSILTRPEVNFLAEVVLNGIAGEASQHVNGETVRRCRRERSAVESLAYNSALAWTSRRELLKKQSSRGWFVPLFSCVLRNLDREDSPPPS